MALPDIGGAAVRPATEWSLPQAILLSVFAFTGFEGALCIAAEARDPSRDFPRALVGVFLLVAMLYALLAWGYVATAYAPGQADKASLLTMATVLAGSAGAVTIVTTAVLSILGSVTVNTFLVSRRLLALERIEALPAWFGAIVAETGVPRNAVLFTVCVVVALAMSGGFTALAVLSVAARLTCVLLISQSEVRAWAGLGVAVAIGFAVKFVAAQGIAGQVVAAD